MNFIRSRSRGYKLDPPVLIHPLMLIGAGEMLTPDFQKKWNISHVLNCAEDEMCPTWFKKSFPDNYYCLNSVDSLSVNILTWYPKFKEIVQNFLRNNCSRIFIHCQCGINRSAFLTLMFVCDVLGYNITCAERAIIDTRPCALTNPAFRKQIQDALSKKAD